VFSFLATNTTVARGTSEPGPYGVIVGDPLLSQIKSLVPDARGYAVNVCSIYITEQASLKQSGVLIFSLVPS
jgi:hypothetical protein